MDSSRFIELVSRKLSGTISEKDEEILNSELSNPQSQEEFEYLKRVWETSGRLDLDLKVNLEYSWQEFNEKRTEKKAKEIQLWPWLSGVAASVLLIIGAFLYLFGSDETIYTTGENQTHQIELADGTKILLNQLSSLTVEEDFGKNQRNVSLSGQAFFEVAHDRTKPFVVKSQGSFTEVLGTSFEINGRPELQFVQVNLLEGKVRFSNGNREFDLLPGMTASLDKKSGLIEELTWNENDLAWRTRKLEFDNALMTSVVRDLSEHFEVDIALENPEIGKCRFTGRFKDPKLDEILQVLSVLLDLKVEKTQTQIILKGKGC